MSDQQRPMMPRIRRVWSARTGEFLWSADSLPEGKWGLGVSQQARYDWRQAWRWCALQNAKERSKP